MNDKFASLRAAVQKFLDRAEMPVGEELIEFRNAASVLTIAELLRSYDVSTEALRRITADSSLGTLTAEEVTLISLFRSVGDDGSNWIMTAAQAAATLAEEKEHKPSADIVELRPKK